MQYIAASVFQHWHQSRYYVDSSSQTFAEHDERKKTRQSAHHSAFLGYSDRIAKMRNHPCPIFMTERPESNHETLPEAASIYRASHPRLVWSPHTTAATLCEGQSRPSIAPASAPRRAHSCWCPSRRPPASAGKHSAWSAPNPWTPSERTRMPTRVRSQMQPSQASAQRIRSINKQQEKMAKIQREGTCTDLAGGDSCSEMRNVEMRGDDGVNVGIDDVRGCCITV